MHSRFALRGTFSSHITEADNNRFLERPARLVPFTANTKARSGCTCERNIVSCRASCLSTSGPVFEHSFHCTAPPGSLFPHTRHSSQRRPGAPRGDSIQILISHVIGLCQETARNALGRQWMNCKIFLRNNRPFGRMYNTSLSFRGTIPHKIQNTKERLRVVAARSDPPKI